MREECRRVTRALAAVLTVALLGAGGGAAIASVSAVAAVAPGVYAGGTPRANRYMDITIQVLRGGRSANWRIDVYGPCTEHERMGRTVGTDAGNTPPDPRLTLRDGSFVLNKHAMSKLDGLSYRYQLTGHAAPGGFAGTFHYSETDHHGYACDSRLLHWRATRSAGTFP
jgi:hypothetical protein